MPLVAKGIIYVHKLTPFWNMHIDFNNLLLLMNISELILMNIYKIAIINSPYVCLRLLIHTVSSITCKSADQGAVSKPCK